MGFNSVLHLRNADLDAIAADPEFGKRTYQVITGSDYEINWRKDRAADAPATVARLSDVAERWKFETPSYELWSAPSQHASGRQLFLVRDGELVSLSGRANRVPFEDWERAATVIKGLGIESLWKGQMDTRKLPAPAVKTEVEVMQGWSEDAFAKATTTLVVTNDHLHDLEKDTRAGARIADAVRRAWADHKAIMAAHAEDPDLTRRGWIADASYAKAVAFTPKGAEDLVSIGGNTGHAIRPHTQAVDVIGYQDEKDRTADKKALADLMFWAGFSVQHETVRMRTPKPFMAKHFADPDFRSNDPEKARAGADPAP